MIDEELINNQTATTITIARFCATAHMMNLLRLWLNSILHRIIAALQEVDPMLQVILVCMTINTQDGIISLDKQTVFAFGMLGLIIFEELI